MPTRVLLFDDDPALRDPLARSLLDIGANVMHVTGEPQLITASQSARPDVVIVAEQRDRNVRIVCDRLARSPTLHGVPIVAVTLKPEAARDGRDGVSAYVTRRAGVDAIAAAARRVLGVKPAAAPARETPPDEDFDFTLVPDEELAITRLSRLSLEPEPPVIVPAASRSLQSSKPPPASKGARARTSARPPAEKPARTSARPPAEKPARTSARPPAEKPARTSARPPAEKLATERPSKPDAGRRSMRPASERQGAAKTKATRRDADIALIERRIIELEDALSTARRERDESDAAWSEWVSSAESFANEMWSDRDA